MSEDNFKSVGDLARRTIEDLRAGRPIKLGDYDDSLWWEYLEAKDLADKTRDLHDGVLAGRAWSRWVAEFVPEQGGVRQAVHGNVVQFPK